jgi:DNA-binding CsgD family transcriptional regulator
LSDSEARVVSLLARGRDIARIANELGVQPNTCRSHLKSAYTKTGTRTQAQLAVLVATSVAIA